MLHGIDGNLEVGEMLAVIGPSGSGKSCLLDILAERKTVGKFSGLRLLDGEVGKTGTKIAGERNAMSACQIWDYKKSVCSILVPPANSRSTLPLSYFSFPVFHFVVSHTTLTSPPLYLSQIASRRRFQHLTAYVTQEDSFHPTSTVKEAVLFRASMRLDRRMPSQERDALALRLIEDVGLKGKEETYVGNPLPGGLCIRGLSGGEKRRLSLCCGTITEPSLLFLDEPTSGLDSFAALAVSNPFPVCWFIFSLDSLSF